MGPGRPASGNIAPRGAERKRQAIHGLAGLVGERDALEIQRQRAFREVTVLGGNVLDLGLQLEQLGQAFDARADGLESAHLAGEGVDGVFKQGHVIYEQIDRTDGDPP